MTTPERFRRRQRLEGFGLVLIGVGVIASSVINNNQNDRQDREVAQQTLVFNRCIVKQFDDLGNYLDARSGTTTANSAAVDDAFEGFAVAAANQDLGQFQKALRDYRADRKQINIDRANSNLPSFPTGRCDPNVEAK